MKSKQLSLFEFNDDWSFYSLVNDTFLPKENFEIEYKSGKGGFPKEELWKSYSAFANTNLGFIIIGVKEKRDKLIIEGLTDKQIDDYQKEFWNNCNNPNTVSRNIVSNKDVQIIEVNTKKLLIIRVPFASRTERPVYLTRNPFGNTYKRNYEGDYRCTDDEVKRMLADSSSDLRRDSVILEGFDLNDLDPTSIKQFRQLFASSNPGHPWLAEEDLELLKKLGAYRKDRKTQLEGVTLAGLLMFGKDESLREQQIIPNYFPDFREKLSADKAIRWTDRIYPDGSWHCNLLQFYLRVWPKLITTLPKPFQLDKDERVDESPAHVALREAFVNTLVHTDYLLSGNITIELESDKFVFSNPGTLLVSLYQYYAGGISECRNPSLQLMFMQIGRAEKAGSGVDKIMSGWKSSLWRSPFIEVYSKPDRVNLTMPMFSVIPKPVLIELNERYDNLDQLSADELTILSFSLIEGSISNQRLQYILNIHSADISIMLRKLCDNNFLISDNKGRWTTYRLTPKVDTSDDKVATHGAKVATSTEQTGNQQIKKTKVDSSGDKVATHEAKVATSTEQTGNQQIKKTKVDTSGDKVATHEAKVATSTEQTGNQQIKKTKVDTSGDKVATYGTKVDTSSSKIPKMLKRDELEKLIMEICKDRFVKMDEVAIMIDRSIDYLKNKIFPQMIRDGKLIKKYPRALNHPEQAYKTKK